jgi:hypothetical protein
MAIKKKSFLELSEGIFCNGVFNKVMYTKVLG